MPSLPKAAWYSFNIHEGNLSTDDERIWEPENPTYDPGPLPEPKPLTETQLRFKRKKAEDRAQQASTQAEGVDSGVSPLLLPISKGQLPTTHTVGGLILSPQASMSARTASGFTMKQVSSYHSAGTQSTARNNSQVDQHSQSTLTNKSGPVGYHPQNAAEVSQTRPFPTTNKRPISEPNTARKHYWRNRSSHSGHVSNRLVSVDIRDNPTTTANP